MTDPGNLAVNNEPTRVTTAPPAHFLTGAITAQLTPTVDGSMWSRNGSWNVAAVTSPTHCGPAATHCSTCVPGCTVSYPTDDTCDASFCWCET
jgi:hypothetical protein